MNWASILARSSCTFRLEVSMTRSASPRSSRRSSRSAAMPSTMRPSPWRGCGRRTDSKRRTRASSEDSRNTMRRVTWRDSRSARDWWRSSKNRRPRTSTTTAIRATFPWERAPSSTIVGIRAGGRLSTTNQPRSSRHLAAVERPAPDIPEMITSSGMAASDAPAVSLVVPVLTCAPSVSAAWPARSSGAGCGAACSPCSFSFMAPAPVVLPRWPRPWPWGPRLQ